LIEDLNLLLGSNAIVTYDVRLGYKTDEMYEDSSSEWKLEVKSRESRSIQCQPTYHYGMENKVSFMFIIIMSRWGQPFPGSDFSMPADLAQVGTGHVHCANTILLCHPAILCMDVPFEIFRPFYQILDVLLVYNRPFCRCGQITLVPYI
jgi:hypothetical protein